MQQFTVPQEQHNRKLVRVLRDHWPALTAGQVFRALSREDIRVNGLRVSRDRAVCAGDELSVYLPDSVLSGDAETLPFPGILYRDDRLLVLNKPQGMPVHPGAGTREGQSVIERVRQNWPDRNYELCHRLDQNTGGILLLAEGQPALRAAQELLRDGGIRKFYRCLVRDIPAPPDRPADPDGFYLYEAWGERHGGRQVYVHATAVPGALRMVTALRVLRVLDAAGPDSGPVSELEIRLDTGRTHQIRAHLAWMGHAVVGDGRYGDNTYNRGFRYAGPGPDGPMDRRPRQQLFATALAVRPLPSNHPLSGLSGRRLEITPEYSASGLL